MNFYIDCNFGRVEVYKLIKLAEEIYDWHVNKNGSGIDGKPLIIPASCVLTEEDEIIYDIIT